MLASGGVLVLNGREPRFGEAKRTNCNTNLREMSVKFVTYRCEGIMGPDGTFPGRFRSK